ncbi:hypothetical protein EUGRSUZ_G01091 [Eucalyptus grandis]|uniref:Uncharacterized protein n=2 Tax=Eucalyptus grandis TaxID=71139 RepID=A0ACC3K2Z3_EUCGR|nr:hypothetical protein EUGRSUZ_G01091 [Eucalyptus grandis]
MFDWVGGITSEMSAVGLLPAALQVCKLNFQSSWLYSDLTRRAYSLATPTSGDRYQTNACWRILHGWGN